MTETKCQHRAASSIGVMSPHFRSGFSAPGTEQLLLSLAQLHQEAVPPTRLHLVVALRHQRPVTLRMPASPKAYSSIV